MLRNTAQSLGPGLILWYNLSNGKWIQEVGWEDMDCIDMAQDRDRWRALVNAVMNIRVP
jgi:hypothetical protein